MKMTLSKILKHKVTFILATAIIATTGIVYMHIHRPENAVMGDFTLRLHDRSSFSSRNAPRLAITFSSTSTSEPGKAVNTADLDIDTSRNKINVKVTPIITEKYEEEQRGIVPCPPACPPRNNHVSLDFRFGQYIRHLEDGKNHLIISVDNESNEYILERAGFKFTLIDPINDEQLGEIIYFPENIGKFTLFGDGRETGCNRDVLYQDTDRIDQLIRDNGYTLAEEEYPGITKHNSDGFLFIARQGDIAGPSTPRTEGATITDNLSNCTLLATYP